MKHGKCSDSVNIFSRAPKGFAIIAYAYAYAYAYVHVYVMCMCIYVCVCVCAYKLVIALTQDKDNVGDV